jgi:hypothetical protein
MAKWLARAAAIVLILALMASFAQGRAFADDGIPSAFDDIVELVEDIATAIVRVILIVSAGCSHWEWSVGRSTAS